MKTEYKIAIIREVKIPSLFFLKQFQRRNLKNEQKNRKYLITDRTGDIKLMLACSVWLGKQAPYFVFFSLLAVIVYNLVLKAKNSLGGLITAAKMEMLYGYKEPSGSIPGAFFITAGFTVCLLYQIFL